MTNFTNIQLKTEFDANVVTVISQSGSLSKTRIEELNKSFKTFGLSNEQIATALVQFHSNAYAVDVDAVTKLTLEALNSQVNSEAVQGKRHLVDRQLKLIHEQTNSELIKQAQVKRDMYSMDDGLKVKKAEYKANVTAFAVNSGSSTAAGLVAELNQNIDALSPYATGSASVLIPTLPAYVAPTYEA